ncbi:MAG: hypothetical protein DCC55_27600, partial [Chloroflexi bacterium]
PRTSGELIAIFDADHAPFAEFLDELIGYFNDPLHAAYEYDAFARNYFGEYARVNFPQRR